jgi:hypothetical protein
VTELATPPTAPDAVPAARPSRSRRDRGRRGIALVMAGALALSAVTRYWADRVRYDNLPHQGEAAVSNTSLSNMDSFALGLLLGGLKGPLVMMLWIDSENQKTEKNLEGVDTEIEWIRLLQPEFDTVHLFQIWNKAYNLSVQMASLANKYDTILGALDYAHNVDAQKPDDINILAAIGQLYFDKLGTSSEHTYYRHRVREESKPHAVDTAARRTDVGWRRMKLDPSLDANFNLLPSARADLPYLDNPSYEPYTDGLSTFAFAYNYYKRCERLMNVKQQHHAQLGDMVVDSRPGLTLKNWADDEVDQARRREAEAFGGSIPDDAVNPDAVLANLPLEHAVSDRAALALAEADYDRATKLAPESLAEYRRHILDYPGKEQQYRLYMSEIEAEGQVAGADRDFLRAVTSPPGAERDRLLQEAFGGYMAGWIGYDRILLRYYTDPQDQALALPKGYAALPTAGQKPIEELPPEQVLQAESAVDRKYAGPRDDDPNGDRFEYLRHVRRAATRINTIVAAVHGEHPTTAPTTVP